MNSERELLSQFDELKNAWPADASIAAAVLARLDREGWAQPASLRAPRWRFPAMRSLAAAALIAIVGLVALNWGGASAPTLYAQVQQSLERAKSVHVTMHGAQPDGSQPEATPPVAEMWYLRDVGFRSQIGPEVRIDDGQHAWRHVAGEPTAYRSSAVGENVGIWDEMLGVQSHLDRDYVRAANRDETIGGETAQCYVPNEAYAKRVTPLPDGRDVRAVVFIAGDFQVRRVVLEARDGDRWTPMSVQKWQYDVAVDPALFRPDFGPDVKIADADQAFNEMFALDRAVYKETRHGLIYAVHRIERFQGGVALLTTVRGTAETLAKFPLQTRRLGPGRIFVEPPAKNYNASPMVGGYFRIPLSSAMNDGVDVQWWILVPRDPAAPFVDFAASPIKLPAAMIPNGSYANVFADANGGVTPILSWDVELVVDNPTPLPELAAITDRAYRDLQLLKAAPTRDLDLGVEKDRFVGRHSSPDDVTAEEFAAAVADHIRFWHAKAAKARAPADDLMFGEPSQ